jgi:hypothetical protein
VLIVANDERGYDRPRVLRDEPDDMVRTDGCVVLVLFCEYLVQAGTAMCFQCDDSELFLDRKKVESISCIDPSGREGDEQHIVPSQEPDT